MTPRTQSQLLAPNRERSLEHRPRRPRRQIAWWALALLAPALGFFILFDYYPLVRVITLSFQSTDLFGRPSGFIGVENYADMFSSPQFLSTLGTTFLFAVGSVTLKLVCGLAIALPMSTSRRASWLARPVVLIPMAVSVAVAGLVFRAMFQPGFGLADQILGSVGLSSPGWLTNPDFALVSVIIVDTWVGIGFTVLILLAALAGVPQEVREAAAIDGAGPVRTGISIVMPLISSSILFLVIYHTVGALREFTVINVLTQGGPADATRTLVIDIWNLAFGSSGGNFGDASARAIVLLVVVGIVSFIQFRVSNKKVHY
ncbi:carbohydrate ABC transporter permease [Microbacterium forte]|uniref:carbohydrate ABC transporter permease n=1 Tax=Microbacterium forte TaxID=2982533 RepID=UPI00289330D1|nr:sugar ABC transporter permease [Microbacterium sp. A(2022)]